MNAIRGALVTLRPVTQAGIAKAHADFQKPELWNAIQWTGAPPLDRFKDRILKWKHIMLWEIVPEGKSLAVGYVGYRAQTGMPFLFIVFLSGRFDIPTAEDALVPVVHHYFAEVWPKLTDYTRDYPLALYIERTVAEDLHPFLVDNGFDPIHFIGGMDNEVMTGYQIKPQTYEAYYGGGGEEEEPILDDEEPG